MLCARLMSPLELNGLFVLAVAVNVAQCERLDGQAGIDGAFEQVGVKGQHFSLPACRAFGKEDAAFTCLKVLDQCLQCAFEVACTAAFQKERAGLARKPADHGPVCHVGLGDEVSRYDGIDQENIEPGDMIGDDERTG